MTVSKKILIVRHVPGNSLAALEPVLTDCGLPFEYVYGRDLSPVQIELQNARGLIILGGRESVAEEEKHGFMAPEKRMILNAVEQNLPVFGICLGAQLIARALGATVERNQVDGVDALEVGWTPITLTPEGERDPVLSALGETSQFQWHSDTFHWPPGSLPLASSSLCPRQAYCLDRPDSKTYAVQFHPEISRAFVGAWLKEAKTMSPEQKQSIWEETEQNFEVYHQASCGMFKAYIVLAY